MATAKKRKVSKRKVSKRKVAKKRAPVRRRVAKKKAVARKKTARKAAKVARKRSPHRYIIAAMHNGIVYYDGKQLVSARRQAVEFGSQSIATDTARAVARAFKSIKMIGVFMHTDSVAKINDAFALKKKSSRKSSATRRQRSVRRSGGAV